MSIGFTGGSPYHHEYETEGNDTISDTFHYTSHSVVGIQYNDGKAAAFTKVKAGLDVAALQEKAKGWQNVNTHMNGVWTKLNDAYTKLFVDGAWSGDDADKAATTFRNTVDSAANLAEYAGSMHSGMKTIASAAASATGVSSDGPSALGQLANYETLGLTGFNGDGDSAEQAYFSLVGKINDGRNQMPSQLEWQAKPDSSTSGSNAPYGGTGSGSGGGGGGGVGTVSAPNSGTGAPAHTAVSAHAVPSPGTTLTTPGKSKNKGPGLGSDPGPSATSPGAGTDGLATGTGTGTGTGSGYDSGTSSGYDSGSVGGAGIGSNGVGIDNGSTLAGYDASGVGGGSAGGLGGGSAAGIGDGSAGGLGGGSAAGLGGGSAGGLAGTGAGFGGSVGGSAGIGVAGSGPAGSGSGGGAGAGGGGRNAAGGQVAPMRGGGGGGDDESERDRSTWLQEDDDVWGETDAPPSVIR